VPNNEQEHRYVFRQNPQQFLRGAVKENFENHW
jgi:hypothetical protein